MEKSHKGMIGVYILRSNITGTSFIGSAPSMLNHLVKHFDKLSSNNHENASLQEMWNMYGSASFEFVCLESVSDKYLLLDRVSYWMKKMSAVPIGGEHQYAHEYASPGSGRLTISKELREELRGLNAGNSNEAIRFLIHFYKQHSKI